MFARSPGGQEPAAALRNRGGLTGRVRKCLRLRSVRQTFGVALGLVALLWVVVGGLYYHTAEGMVHATWAFAFTLLFMAFAAFVVRRAIQERARSIALEGSELRRLRAQAEREYFAQLVEGSSDAIISRAVDGTILSWNRGATALFGYTAEEAIGRSIEIIVPPEQLGQHRLRRSLPVERGTREVSRVARNGRRIQVEITTAPIHGPGAEILGISVIARDVTAARAAEEALRASEERLREAQRLAHLGSWAFDLRTRVPHWSDEFFRILELDPAHITPSYEAFLERVHPDDREAVNAAYTESVSQRRPYSIDHRLCMPDGRIRHVHEECVTEYDPAGEPLRSLGTIQDITDRKNAEEARAWLAAIVESADDAIIGRTLEGTITSWNAAAERLFGYTAQEAIGQSMAVIWSAGPRRLTENTERLKRGEVIPPFESLRPHRDGTLTPVLSRLSPIRDAAGNVTGVSVIIRDLREQKKVEAQLTLAAAVFEHAAEGIIITDAQNHIVSVNRAFTRITGYEADEVIGQNPRMLASGMQSPDFYTAMWQKIGAHGFWQGEVWDKRKNGELYCQSLSIAAIKDAGRAAHYCAVFMDITSRKNAELALVRLNAELEARVAERTRALAASNQLLLQANEELKTFSYSVSHDLRGPVRRIHAYTSIALDALSPAEQAARQALGRIKVNAEQMAALIEDLLRLSQVSTRELVIGRVDVTAMALEISSRLREQNALHAVTFTVEDGLVATGDAGLVHILLENLIGNAWKFTAGVRSPEISLRTTAAPEGRVYCVRDNGAGFDMARVDKLFRPFSRLHDSATYPGTGIGLTIVQRVAARHGGRVWAEGKVGAGATFYFTLGEPSPGDR